MRARRLAYPGSRWVRHIGIKNVLALADADIAIVDALGARRDVQNESYLFSYLAIGSEHGGLVADME